MKAFRFTLEAVLLLRSREEDAAKALYAEAVAFVNRTREALEQAIQDLEGLQAELSVKRQGTSKRDDQILFMQAIRQQRAFSDSLTQRLARAEQLAETRMQAWLAARRQTEILNRLKGRHLERYKAEVLRHEERAMDDLVSARWALKNRILAN